MKFTHSLRAAGFFAVLLPGVLLAAERSLTLTNGIVTGRWTLANGQIRPLDLTDISHKRTIALAPADFEIFLEDGSRVRSDEMKVVGTPRVESVGKDSNSPKRSDGLGGKRLVVVLASNSGSITATLSAVVRNGSRYLREELSIGAIGSDLPIKKVQLIDLASQSLAVFGSASGSPLAGPDLFAGVEDPLSVSSVKNGRAQSWLERKLPIRAGQKLEVSSVIGFADQGQLRRTFLNYVERERAHPYRTFLHYNSWYDIGYFTPYNEKE